MVDKLVILVIDQTVKVIYNNTMMTAIRIHHI